MCHVPTQRRVAQPRPEAGSSAEMLQSLHCRLHDGEGVAARDEQQHVLLRPGAAGTPGSGGGGSVAPLSRGKKVG